MKRNVFRFRFHYSNLLRCCGGSALFEASSESATFKLEIGDSNSIQCIDVNFGWFKTIFTCHFDDSLSLLFQDPFGYGWLFTNSFIHSLRFGSKGVFLVFVFPDVWQNALNAYNVTHYTCSMYTHTHIHYPERKMLVRCSVFACCNDNNNL